MTLAWVDVQVASLWSGVGLKLTLIFLGCDNMLRKATEGDAQIGKVDVFRGISLHDYVVQAGLFEFSLVVLFC